MVQHSTIDHTGITGTGAPSEITTIPTAEMDTDLVLSPDGAGGVEWVAVPGGAPVFDIERYTGGDVTVSSTSAGADMSGVSDVVVAAAAGDLVMIGANVRAETPNASSSCRFDVKCITGSTENYVSSRTTTPAGQAISGWLFGSGTAGRISGELPYEVQAADISGGNLTLSLRAWLSSANNWVIAADSDAPLLFWVRNLGQ